MDCKKGDYIEWCSGGYEHEHDCGPDAGTIEEPGTQCGFERHSGTVLEVRVVPTFEGEPDKEAAVVETGADVPNVTVNTALIVKVTPKTQRKATAK